MKIKLIRMILENYKCFQGKVIDFFQKTEVSGKNRQGKSTLMNAYMETMTGKETDGSMPDSIRPHDKDGKEIDKVDVIRQIDIEMDGKPVSIRKITKQKWTKPRGQTEERFDGNSLEYEIDDGIKLTYAPKKFEAFMAELFEPEIFAICSNPKIFIAKLMKSETDGRMILEHISGFDIEQFVSRNPQFSEAYKICKGHQIEEVLKSLKKDVNTEKKKLEKKNTEINYERTREKDTPQIEIADLELAKGEWNDKLAEIDEIEKMLDESVKTYDTLSGEIKSLKEKANSVKLLANSALYTQRNELRKAINDTESKKTALTNDLNKVSASLEFEKGDVAFYQKEIDRARANYTEYSKREFDEAELRKIEAEQFDESSLICPTCEQAFPEDKQEELRLKFESGKKERINKEQARKADFDNQTEGLLDNVVKAGNRANESLERAKKSVEDYEKKITEIQADIESETKEIDNLNTELAALPLEEDLSGNVEYQEILSQIAEKETTLSGLNNGSEQRASIRSLRNDYYAEISKIDSQIQRQVAESDEKERRLGKLESEQKEISQAIANIERKIDIVMNFSIQKNAALAEKINSHFKHFQFVFLMFTQLENNPYEVCRMMVDGVDYKNGLNHSDKMLAEIDLAIGLQEINGLNLPIWIDDCESIDPERIPRDLEQQLIVLRRDDCDLKSMEF